MKELISRLTSQAGLSQEQALGAVDTIKDYLTEKFPMMEGIMEKVIGNEDEASTDENNTGEEGSESSGIADKAGDMMDSMKEKASELLSGEGSLGDIADDAKGMAEDAINKLKNMFGKE